MKFILSFREGFSSCTSVWLRRDECYLRLRLTVRVGVNNSPRQESICVDNVPGLLI